MPDPVRRALALSALMPGLGHLSLGWTTRGLTVWSISYGVALGSVLLWARAQFVPVVAAAGLALAWLGLQISLRRDLLNLPRPAPATSPAGWALAVAFVALGLVPPAAVVWVVSARFVGVARVADGGMFPLLLEGDAVVYDRRGFDGDRPPQPGELVVVAEGTRARIGRVLAVGGQTVRWRGTRIEVDGAPLPRAPVGAIQVPRFAGELAVRLARHEGYLEVVEGRRYLTCEDALANVSGDDRLVEVPPGALYVVGDNRSAALAEGRAGAVGLEAVLGQPRFVWGSHDREGRRRVGRGGLVFR